MIDKNLRKYSIHQFILENVSQYDTDIVRRTAEEFGISRQAINRHIAFLISENYLAAQGKTRKKYTLGKNRIFFRLYEIENKLDESAVWYDDFNRLIKPCNVNIDDIGDYVFTEMLNNAIDHSSGTKVLVMLRVIDEIIEISIVDDGCGIFKHIADYAKLANINLALLELSKGKFTTDPKNHTGQGIFFSSKAVDYFKIESMGLSYSQGNEQLSFSQILWTELICSHIAEVSTAVILYLSKNSETELKRVFDYFAPPENDFNFSCTRVPVKLATYERNTLMSRSQAKRILTNLDKFSEIELDFEGIEMIGQGFADQIFRVYQSQNPHVEISVTNANTTVAKMIERAKT